jgi:hypothetical protein
VGSMRRLGLIAIAVLVTVQPGCAGAAPVGKHALIYGDSLTWESRVHIAARFTKKTGWVAAVHSWPSTQPCVWNDWLDADLEQHQPSIVTIATSANRYSATAPCAVDANGQPLQPGTQAFYDHYAAELDEFFARVTATGARVLYLVAPPMLDPQRNADILKIATIAKGLAAKYHGVSIATGARNALARNGKYTPTKPCLATETAAMGCVDGRITIRTVVGPQTGVHLCPDGLGTEYPYACATSYASGEYRWARAMVNLTVTPPAPVVP